MDAPLWRTLRGDMSQNFPNIGAGICAKQKRPVRGAFAFWLTP